MKKDKKQRSDEWYTPKYIFVSLGAEFDLDVASPVDKTFCEVPAKKFLTHNGLEANWTGFVWMNPPYGHNADKTRWLDKMYSHGNGIALMPDRTSAPWWQRAAKQAGAIMFVNGKIKFIKPDGTLGEQPGNGTTLFAYGNHAINRLTHAEHIHGLGILFKR